MEDKAREYAGKYFNDQYMTLMRLFSTIFTQLEIDRKDITDVETAALAAYYTIVSHFQLNNVPYVHLIEEFIKADGEKGFDKFQRELAYQLLIENKVHELESQGLVEVKRTKDGGRRLILTTEGREKSIDISGLIPPDNP